MLEGAEMRVATLLATHTTIWQLVPDGDVQCWCGFWDGGRYRARGLTQTRKCGAT